MNKLLFPYPIVAALLALLLIAGCNHSEGAETEGGGGSELSQASTMTVTTQAAETRSYEGRMIVTGTVEPWQELTVSSETGGLRITSIPFERGDYVDRGDALVYLNNDNLRAQLAAAQARYASAEAALDKAKNPNRRQEIAAQEATVQQARAAVAQEEANLVQARVNQGNAARTAKRFEQALHEGYVTALETDQRVTDREAQEAAIRAAEGRVKAAQANLRQAQEQLNLSRAQGRSEDIAIAEAQRQESAAAVQQIQAQLDQTVIKAPDSGRILEQKAFIGDVVTVGQELFNLARQGRLQLWASVPQADLRSLTIGQTVKFSGSSGVEGRIEEIDPRINPETRQGRARVSLENNTEVKVGAFLQGEIALPKRDVLVVPFEAIVGSTEKPAVFLLEGSEAKMVEVGLGQRQGEMIEIQSGLSKGQNVIVSGAAFLNDGDPVRLAK